VFDGGGGKGGYYGIWNYRGGGKGGYQGICYKCGEVGHKANECRVGVNGVEGDGEWEQKEECSVEIGGVWDECAVEANGVGEKSAEEKFFEEAKKREDDGERVGTKVVWEFVSGRWRQMIKLMPQESCVEGVEIADDIELKNKFAALGENKEEQLEEIGKETDQILLEELAAQTDQILLEEIGKQVGGEILPPVPPAKSGPFPSQSPQAVPPYFLPMPQTCSSTQCRLLSQLPPHIFPAASA
jgi:hypothetical protein